MSLLGLGAYDSSSEEDSDADNESQSTKEEKKEPKQEEVREILANPFMTTNTVLSVKPSFMQETEKISGLKFDNSVFQNPFRDKEDKKTAVLEQHVEMTQREQTGRTIQGKKVCWNFRKGRCRNGHNCKFAHDNDIKNSVTEKLYTDTKKYEAGSQVSNDKAGNGATAPLPLEKDSLDPEFEHISQTGHKLMEKMGWEKGKGLGAKQNGIVKPIQVNHWGGRQGDITNSFEEDEQQVVRKKRPGLSDELTLSKKARAFHDKVYKQ